MKKTTGTLLALVVPLALILGTTLAYFGSKSAPVKVRSKTGEVQIAVTEPVVRFEPPYGDQEDTTRRYFNLLGDMYTRSPQKYGWAGEDELGRVDFSVENQRDEAVDVLVECFILSPYAPDAQISQEQMMQWKGTSIFERAKLLKGAPNLRSRVLKMSAAEKAELQKLSAPGEWGVFMDESGRRFKAMRTTIRLALDGKKEDIPEASGVKADLTSFFQNGKYLGQEGKTYTFYVHAQAVQWKNTSGNELKPFEKFGR